jgi:protein O-GlcNAc transferase
MLGAMSENTPEHAHSLARSGDMRGAARTLAHYLETAPGDTSAHFQLAHLMLELGDPSQAVQSFHRALALEPDNAMIHSDLGTALEELGQETEAAEAYRRGAQIRPPFPPAHHNLALILCRRGQWEEAVEHLRVALAQAPDFGAARHQLGLALAELGQEEAARACFEELLAADAKNIEARRAVAEMDMRQCRFADAARELQQCLISAPEDARATLALGSCLQELGRLDEALAHYRRLLKGDRSRYYDVVKKLTSASTGRFWVNAAELRRVLLG